MIRILKQITSIRVWIRWSKTARRIWIEPIEEDIELATEKELVALWNEIDVWCRETMEKRPGWTVNGGGFGVRVEEDEEVI